MVKNDQETAPRHATGGKRLSIFDGPVAIGTATLTRVDRSAGALICRFEPTSDYDRCRHAVTGSRDTQELAGTRLHAAGHNGGSIAALDVRIYDHQTSAGRYIREAYVIGIDLDTFDRLLADDG